MSTMQFDLVSPERRLATVQASSVLIPGADGDMTVMPDHAPVITTLRPGVLVVNSDAGEEKYAVFGGFAQITADTTSVLAEKAIAVGEATAADVDAALSAAQSAAEGKEGADKDQSDKLLADLGALRSALGV